MFQKKDLEIKAISDLHIGMTSFNGTSQSIQNCYHFSSDGSTVDAMFFDRQDFIDGMNRIFTVSRLFPVLILAFTLMDNHIHFVLYGNLEDCRRFFFEYIRRTSMAISERHSLKNHLSSIKTSYQEVDTSDYLKTVICYCNKNATAAGIKVNTYDYPWSSAALYFRISEEWTTPEFMKKGRMQTVYEKFPTIRKRLPYFHTNDDIPLDVLMAGDIIFPGEYVAFELVEKLFISHKSFNYFMSRTKAEDVDNKGGNFAYLAIPDHEIRQIKNEICRELFGVDSVRSLSTDQRLKVARSLWGRYRCSVRQISTVCGLDAEDLAKILGVKH